MLPVELFEPVSPIVTQRLIEKLAEEHANAIPIFGGALWVNGIDGLVDYLPTLISSAKFFGWHETLADTCRRFCRLCFVDPALVECYIGVRFDQLVA